ncbi:hypothetical protein KGF56_003290 [Candida oxycetoniae]|uniref:Rho GDP-dissociation inhibitor n=1 Tax=Candida oxycetoniae TaxID=497107 RepID=A0AAI9SW73_9ASCO|nr:uncharacterized protein KGF56_003290 [Candida oxycetoniae]KAI3403860.1 hypothetical protein KGF56_003290 [Candida oxycetoniae]
MSLKTREQLLADFENELIRFEAMSIKIDGYEQPLVFSRDMDPIPQRLYFILPEYSVYHLTIRFKVKRRSLKNLTYHQTVKKSGIIVDSRDLPMAQDAYVNDHTNENDYHEVTFARSGLPGGSFLRTEFTSKSIIRENGKKIWSYRWILQIVEKSRPPAIGGFI